MTTGDISNNIRKMRSKLKEIKYTEDFDVNSLAEGQPKAYLPIYHYAFTNYSPPVAQLILDKGIELFGKSDARFMEAVYKILRDIFAYKPPITKEQFFAKGFAERKVIMCTGILQLIKQKHTELNPAPSKTALKTSVRPKSAIETRNLPLAVPKTKRPDTSRASPRDPDRMVQRCAPHVVNELVTLARNEPVRHLSTSASHPHPVRHKAGNESLDSSDISDQSESIPSKPPSILSQHAALLRAEAKPVRHVSIQSPRQTEMTPPKQGNPTDMWAFEDTPDRHLVRTNFITPSIKKVCTKSVEVVCMPKGQYREDNEDTSIVEIQAPTSDSVLLGPVPTSNIDIANLYETVEMLGNKVQQLAQVHQGDGNSGTNEKIETVLSKIENLTARILLLENRVSIIESKMGDVQLNTSNNNSGPGRFPVTETIAQTQSLFEGPGNSFAEELKAMSASQKLIQETNANFSVNFSPIRQVGNGLTGNTVSANEDTFALETEDDARRSSTPTMNGTFGESSFGCDISHMETKDAVTRIRNMIKETTQMMTENQDGS